MEVKWANEEAAAVTISVAKEEEQLSAVKATPFEMPVHYPRYSKSDYDNMDEWKLDFLLRQYGLHPFFKGNTLDDKRRVAIATFLWPHQL